MKKLFAVLAIILPLTCCVQAQDTPTKKDLKNFGKGFITALKSGDLRKTIPYFNEAYFEEQHNANLQGNTEQFVEEFLGGMINPEYGNPVFYTPKLSEISSVKLKNVVVLEQARKYYIEYEIKMKDKTCYTIQVDVFVDGNGKLGFVGAMG